jgi:hypothetical protein
MLCGDWVEFMIGRGMRVFDLRYMKSGSGLGDGVL